MKKPKLFIISYNRVDLCFSLKCNAFQGFEKYVVLHDGNEAKRYKDVAKKTNTEIIVSNTKPLYPGSAKVRQQKFVYDSLDEGEWAIFADDDIIDFRSLHPDIYWKSNGIPKLNRRSDYPKLWSHTPDKEEFMEMQMEMINICEKEKIGYAGLHVTDAFSSLQKSRNWSNGINGDFIRGWERSKWGFNVHPNGMHIIKKDKRIQLNDKIELDDVYLWAKAFLVYGKVLINKWLLMDSPLYGKLPGGMQTGSKIERGEARSEACLDLIKLYPGLFQPGGYDVGFLNAVWYPWLLKDQLAWRSQYIVEHNFNPESDVAP